MIKIDKDKLGLQDYFYIGYLYLIILGLVSDAIFYGVFGVTYLNYTTILDALISPVSLLANNWLMALILAVLFALMYMYFSNWMFKVYAYLREKKWYQKIYDIEKGDKKYERLRSKKNPVLGLMFMFFMLFVSMRLGMALGIRSKVSEKEIIPNYTLVFKDNSKLNVKKVGQNSAYFFYFVPGEKTISATPIADNLKQIKRFKKIDE
ncbi:conserved membrane hypothetical protein [Tenacibaculum litoreum]|uniref:hypothetical protein n=1 Tax=Tenacibaculum litoreum TaxID=321269 RepID=UPI003894F2A9